MKILVVGTVNRDTIVRPGEEVREGFGGLLYTLFTLALLTERETHIVPVFNLGQDVARRVLELLRSYPQISTNGIRVVPEMNNHAMLTYRSESERDEILEGGVPPVEYEQIAPFLKSDILLVNFVSGRDITLETLMKIRSHSRAVIYADLHSLTLGTDQRGRRYWRQFPQWPHWTSQMDIVQMNRGEACLLSESRMESDADFVAFGKRVLESGPSILLITLGQEGSALVTDQQGHILLNRISPHPPVGIRDTTGCGDIFLAAFLTEFVRCANPQQASHFANQMAGARCGLGGLEELDELCRFIPKEGKSC